MHLAIIGCGAMGSSMAKSFAKNKNNVMLLFDRNFEKSQSLSQEIQATACKELTEAVQRAEAILIAVKPYHLEPLSQQLSPLLPAGAIIISVLAGIKIADLKRCFPKHPVTSIMPNIAVAYGKGVIGVVDSPELTPKMATVIKNLLVDAGLLLFLPENKIDALAALAGSSPAFVLHLIESMVDGGVLLGFPAEKSLDIVIKVFEGALALLKETRQTPQTLKWQVASPGGTTIEGLKVLEEERVHYALMQALEATCLKAKKLAQQN